MIVVDASTNISASLEDEHVAVADRVLDYVSEKGAFVPGNFYSEIVNALAKAEPRGRIETVKADITLTEIVTLPLTIEMPHPHAVFSVVRGHRLTAYDAACLALALQHSGSTCND